MPCNSHPLCTAEATLNRDITKTGNSGGAVSGAE